MNKTLLLGLTLSSALLLTACGTKEETPLESDINADIDQETLLSTDNEITMTCPEAIQDYLNTANLEGEGEVTIQANDAIVVDYIGRLSDGTVFDTSVESVAKACGKYSEGRDYNGGLSFTVGAGQMIPGFDAAVVGMKVGQTKTANLTPAEAYGEYQEDLLQSYPTADIPNADQFTEGMQLMIGYGATATVVKVTDKEITLDLNHELAGKDLIFDITIKSIN
jgi:FKBP-type peptidyl-prolyl cis-trans isomerase 2